MVKNRTKYFAKNIRYMNNLENNIINLRRARAYWSTFKIGDNLEVAYLSRVRANITYKQINDGVIIHKNDHFMDIRSIGKNKVVTIRTEDLILEKHRARIRHKL